MKHLDKIDYSLKNNFIFKIINKEIKKNKNIKICTRFSPEPNGYLHLGHAKSICLNFGIAKKYNGKCNLRFDDTNPNKIDIKFIKAIKKDIIWLGFKWNKEKYTSEYFNIIYKYAIKLINKGLAYVDSLSRKDIKLYRGTLNVPGKNSPFRNRSIKENLDLFNKMKEGKFSEGKICLRAKINMLSPIIIMRDPVLYRIKFKPHLNTGDIWCIYPTYDFSHCISDALEKITHSLCTLEFIDNRVLYNWILNNIDIKHHPKQYEFSKLEVEYMLSSKRKLKKIIKNNIINSWNDPRMPTISGLRNKGYTAKSIIKFCNNIGITKQENMINISFLEHCIRSELNISVPRLMAVINPIKLIIFNLPKNFIQQIEVNNHPNNINLGKRKIIFSRELYIDFNDFKESADNSYKRLMLGKKVKLRYSYIIKAKYFKRDKLGKIYKIYCKYYIENYSKKNINLGIIHWVSAIKFERAEFNLYENLFINKNPSRLKNFMKDINYNSLLKKNGVIEKNIKYFKKIKRFQFEREGYFILVKNFNNKLIFNRIVSLKQDRFKY